MSEQLIVLIIGLLASGLLAGVIAGLLGVGGGVVMVPVLFQTFIFMNVAPALQMHMAVASSLAIIIFISLRSARAHAARGKLDMEIVKSWGVWIFCGAAIGALAARFISADQLKIIFASLALILGVKILMTADSVDTSIDSSVLGASGASGQGFSLRVQKALAGLIGLFSALMGIGGGTFSTPLLRHTGRDIHQAVATSSALGFLIAIPATIGFIVGGWGIDNLPAYSLGYVNIIAFLVLLPTTMIGAPWGVRLAHYLSPKALRYIFAAFLLLTALRMGVAIFIG